MWYDGGMGKEWQHRLRPLWRWLKLFGLSLAYLIPASFCVGAEVLLFFTLQETWKDWQANRIPRREFFQYSFLFILLHTPFFAGVLWLSRQVQRLWSSVDDAQGG